MAKRHVMWQPSRLDAHWLAGARVRRATPAELRHIRKAGSMRPGKRNCPALRNVVDVVGLAAMAAMVFPGNDLAARILKLPGLPSVPVSGASPAPKSRRPAREATT